jgi:DNA invertase Pin-like site-specific DNA recombinase
LGYARCSTDQQDLTAQHDGLAALGVDLNRVYGDQGLTGTNRERPGLREALAACREGDTLVVTKLDRLARSLPDARAIADELIVGQVRLNLADLCTTRRTRSAGCCSTCSRWLPSSLLSSPT